MRACETGLPMFVNFGFMFGKRVVKYFILFCECCIVAGYSDPVVELIHISQIVLSRCTAG